MPRDGRPIHGHCRQGARRSEHQIWSSMWRRCVNSNDASYPRYGGRGIVVCDRWVHYINFYADMGPRPSAKHSIDRINNDGNYDPGNVRWATRSEQNKNRDNSLMARGERVSLAVLTESEVREIRGLAAMYSRSTIAAEFGVTKGTINHIVWKRTWRHVE